MRVQKSRFQRQPHSISIMGLILHHPWWISRELISSSLDWRRQSPFVVDEFCDWWIMGAFISGESARFVPDKRQHGVCGCFDTRGDTWRSRWWWCCPLGIVSARHRGADAGRLLLPGRVGRQAPPHRVPEAPSLPCGPGPRRDRRLADAIDLCYRWRWRAHERQPERLLRRDVRRHRRADCPPSEAEGRERRELRRDVERWFPPDLCAVEVLDESRRIRSKVVGAWYEDRHCEVSTLPLTDILLGGLTLIVGTQKWGFSCKVQRRPSADIFLNESLPPKNPLRTPCSWPPWPWFSREKSLKIFKVL